MAEPDASTNDAPNFKPFAFGVVALSLGLLIFFWGESVGGQKSASAAEPIAQARPAAEDHLSRAARLAHAQLRALGLPADRHLRSVEAFYDEERQLCHLVRIWPPWSVSQPEDSTPPLMWRAIVVDSQGRCRLTAINDPGEALSGTAFAQPALMETEPRVEPPADSATPASQGAREIPQRRRRAILPPPSYDDEKPARYSPSGRRLVDLPPPAWEQPPDGPAPGQK